MDSFQQARWLKQQAALYRFSLAGITDPSTPDHVEVFDDWLKAGLHGEMQYLSNPRARRSREDPRTLLPGCQSILVLTSPYQPARPSEDVDRAPRISTYALGEDYHEVLLERAERLIHSFAEHIGETFKYAVYTDTGPILEREMAQRAGLGWIGKNTCLIHPRQGSFHFLVEVLMEVNLPKDPPFTSDHCGSCTRCIDACPTVCILPNRTVDATRCISYLTIELKGSIPLAQRAEMGSWAFGCDVCQEVCPWNLRFAESPEDPAFDPQDWLDMPDLPALLQMDAAEFMERTDRSPLSRAKHRGFLRNLAVVAGNSGKHSLIPLLTDLLGRHQEVLTRGHAAWALGVIGGPGAEPALKLALQQTEDPQLKQEIEAALQNIWQQPR